MDANENLVIGNYAELRDCADRVERIRIELYRNPLIEGEEKKELSDLLFMLQSKLRYDTKEIIQCFVPLDD